MEQRRSERIVVDHKRERDISDLLEEELYEVLCERGFVQANFDDMKSQIHVVFQKNGGTRIVCYHFNTPEWYAECCFKMKNGILEYYADWVPDCDDVLIQRVKPAVINQNHHKFLSTYSGT